MDTTEPSSRKRPVKKSEASVTVGDPETLWSAMRISSAMATSRFLITSKVTAFIA